MMNRRGIAWGLGLGLGLGLGCSSPTAFECSEDAECGAEGTCQVGVGFCSFPDERCPSAQRYGEHAGDGLAGTCVEQGGSSSSTGDPSPEVSDDGADSSTGIAPACPGATSCVPPAPPDWEGPLLALRDTEGAPACPAEAPEARWLGHAGLIAPDATCACECPGIDCAVEAYATFDGRCGKENPAYFDPDTCLPVPTEMLPPETAIYIPAVGCGSPSASMELPSTEWTDHVRLCAPEAQDCAQGTCVPDSGTGSGVCIYRAGEHACPSSAYTQTFTYYEDLVDDRGCSPCGCIGRGTCNLTMYDNLRCAEPPYLDVDLDVDLCVLLEDILPPIMGATPALVVQPVGEPTCEATGGGPIGAGTAVEPLTLCCLP